MHTANLSKHIEKFVDFVGMSNVYQSLADVNNLQQYNRLFLRQKQFDFTLKCVSCAEFQLEVFKSSKLPLIFLKSTFIQL